MASNCSITASTLVLVKNPPFLLPSMTWTAQNSQKACSSLGSFQSALRSLLPPSFNFSLTIFATTSFYTYWSISTNSSYAYHNQLGMPTWKMQSKLTYIQIQQRQEEKQWYYTKDHETHILMSWKTQKNHTQTLNTKTTHKCWTQKTTDWWNLMENNITTHQQIREHEKLDITYLWMRRPTVAATMSQAKRRWAATNEEQMGSFQRVLRNGFACTVCALFWWFCGW